jgi:hypothetical protein
MTTRTAQCSCGRVKVTVQGEPQRVYICHCDFCQKRSGTTGTQSAWFTSDQVLQVAGDTKIYNGLELDGVGVAELGLDASFYFCATCGSTVFSTIAEIPGVHALPVGCFVDPDFPPPTEEYWTDLRPDWLASIPDAVVHERYS